MNKLGQLKIQQMAFVLVAIILFFALVALFYFSISYSNLLENVEDLREQEVRELVRKMTGTPEFTWSIYDCDSCMDLDKLFALKNRKTYEGFWRNIPLIQVVRVYPTYGSESGGIECELRNYPECDIVTLVDDDINVVAHSAFVSLCYYDAQIGSKCELGKIIMGFETIE